MKKIISSIIIILAFSCNPDIKKPHNNLEKSKVSMQDTIATKNTKKEFVKNLENLFGKYRQKQKIYKIAFKEQAIKTKSGVAILFDPNVFALDTLKLSKKDTVELVFSDYYTKKSFILNKLQTISNKGLLISNGMFFVDVKYNGQSLAVKDKKYLKMQFPVTNKRKMDLYYKESDTSVWIKSKQKLMMRKRYFYYNRVYNIEIESDKPIDDVIEPLGEQTELNSHSIKQRKSEIKKAVASSDKTKTRNLKRAFYDIKLNKLGWINTDAFYKSEVNTNVKVKLSKPENVDIAASYLVFQDINAVLMRYVEKETDFPVIPINARVKLITIYTDGNSLYYDEQKFTTAQTNIIEVNLKKISEKVFIKNLEEL